MVSKVVCVVRGTSPPTGAARRHSRSRTRPARARSRGGGRAARRRPGCRHGLVRASPLERRCAGLVPRRAGRRVPRRRARPHRRPPRLAAGEESPGIGRISFVRALPGARPRRDGPALGRGALADRTGAPPALWRYVQNVVVEPITADAPEIDGIAELRFRSVADLRERFYDSEEGKRIVAEDVASSSTAVPAGACWPARPGSGRRRLAGVSLPPDAHSTYDAHDPVEDAPRARKHALVREVKRVIELTAHLDVEEADLDEVDALASEVDAESDRLEPLPSLHAKGGLGSVGGDDGALLERSGISGRSNPLAAPLQWGPVGAVTRGVGDVLPRLRGTGRVRARRVRRGGVRRPVRDGADGVGHRRLHRHAHGEDAAADPARASGSTTRPPSTASRAARSGCGAPRRARARCSPRPRSSSSRRRPGGPAERGTGRVRSSGSTGARRSSSCSTDDERRRRLRVLERCATPRTGSHRSSAPASATLWNVATPSCSTRTSPCPAPTSRPCLSAFARLPRRSLVEPLLRDAVAARCSTFDTAVQNFGRLRATADAPAGPAATTGGRRPARRPASDRRSCASVAPSRRSTCPCGSAGCTPRRARGRRYCRGRPPERNADLVVDLARNAPRPACRRARPRRSQSVTLPMISGPSGSSTIATT